MEEDEAPAKPRRARLPRVEPFEDDVTVDDLIEELENFEGEPTEGGLRELKPLAEELGIDVKELIAQVEEAENVKLTAKERAEEVGMCIASSNNLLAKIVATLKEDEGAMDDIIEELALELSERARPAAIAKAIVIELNNAADDADGEDDGAEDEDDDIEDEKPARRKRAPKAEAEDELDDDKPVRRKRRAAKEDADLDELDD